MNHGDPETKMSAMTDRYHHGDLPNALRAAAADVIAESGIGGLPSTEYSWARS